MHPIHTVLNQNGLLRTISDQLSAYQKLQDFWGTATPKEIGENSYVSHLNNTILIVFTHSALVANKVKLTQANLLMQLEILKKTNPKFTEYQVTAIVVKVQAKSQPKKMVKVPRVLSLSAAISLEKLAGELSGSDLSLKLSDLAKKAK
jgi:hypothetical protein